MRPRAASVAFVCLAAIVASLSPAPLVQMTVGTVLRFAAIVTLAMTVTARSGQPVVRAISKLGRHSIAVFILHRPVIQAFQFAIARVELPASARYVFLYPATIACMVMMCMLRDRHQGVDRMLRDSPVADRFIERARRAGGCSYFVHRASGADARPRTSDTHLYRQAEHDFRPLPPRAESRLNSSLC